MLIIHIIIMDGWDETKQGRIRITQASFISNAFVIHANHPGIYQANKPGGQLETNMRTRG